MKKPILNPGDLVLVTGGAGYVGSHLVRMLLGRGYRVRVLDTFLYGDKGLQGVYAVPELEVEQGDICNIRDVMRVTKGARAVIALAALVGDGACDLSHDETLAINIESTKILAEVVKANSDVERIVFASSCSVYGAADDLLINEGSCLNPVSFYARSRIMSEGILSHTLEDRSVVTLRLGTVFGPSTRMRLDLMVNTMTARAVADGKIRVTGGSAWRPHVHVEDVARAFMLAAESSARHVSGEVFNVGSNANNYTIADTAKIVAGLIPGTEIAYGDSVEDPRSYRVSFDKIRHVLGFQAQFGVADGVRQVCGLLRDGSVDPGDLRYYNVNYLERHGFQGEAVQSLERFVQTARAEV